MNRPKHLKLLLFSLLLIAVYSAGRLYFYTTDGFVLSNIYWNLPYDPKWEVKPLPEKDMHLVEQILSQKFTYLGKGCQSYVFESQDGKLAIKFFKYQRFKNKPWLDFFSFIPFVESYRQSNLEKKKQKLDDLFLSWKIAFNDLQQESELVYVHLNPSSNLQKKLFFSDKIGIEHRVDLDQMQFLIQRKGKLLTAALSELMEQKNEAAAKKLIEDTVDLILSEYKRGLADNDHALMQNTGVYQGHPFHMDVGQFVYDQTVKSPPVFKQLLLNKTYKFKWWLEEKYPDLALALNDKLKTVLGKEFYTMTPEMRD